MESCWRRPCPARADASDATEGAGVGAAAAGVGAGAGADLLEVDAAKEEPGIEKRPEYR